MEKRTINSFGTITIPKHMRDELGISGTMMLWVDVRETKKGEKEIVLRRSDSCDEILEKYKTWAEVVSRICECSVSIVWNNTVLSMSSNSITEEYVGKNITVNPILSMNFKKISSGGVIVSNPEELNFLPNGNGNVVAYYKLNGTGDDSCFFVVVRGTKYDVKRVSKLEETRRLHIVNDILSNV